MADQRVKQMGLEVSVCTEEYDMQWKQGNKCKLKSQQALREEYYQKKKFIHVVKLGWQN